VAREYRFDKEKIVFAGRFELKPKPERLLLSIKGRKALSVADVQHLYDLFEALPLKNKALAIALPPDYVAQGQDIRWVVDAYNLLDKRNCAFSVIVGSMENHSTFINLGLDSHIKLELELERTAALELQQLMAKGENLPGSMASELGAAGQLPGASRLTPSAKALVTQISELISAGDLAEAARAWRRLVSEGIDRSALGNLRPLRHELFEKLLTEGKEAFNQDDFATATERFNLLIDLDPGRYEGHYYKGLLLKHEGKLEYAQAFLTQAILAAPDEAELFYHRAIVRSRVNDMEGAMRDLNMALDHNPRMVQAYYNRARLHKKMGHDDLARHDLKLYEKLKKEQERAGGQASNESGERPAPEKLAGKKK
jgi:tetratricopeptide (TPR) repeat protein